MLASVVAQGGTAKAVAQTPWFPPCFSLTEFTLARGSLSLLEFDARTNGLSIAQDFHLHHVTHFTSAESVGEVVKVLDWLVPELHENVSRLETCFGRRRARLHIRETNSILNLSEIRDRAEIGPVTSPASSCPSRPVFRHR